MALQQFNAEGGLSVGNSLASVSVIAADGNISTTANITGNYVLGNGSQLAGLPEGYSNTKVGSYLEIYSGNIEFGNLIGNTSFGDKKIKLSQGSLPEMGVLVDYQGITISTGTPLAPQHGQFGIYATGNVTSTGNVAAANLLTDNLLYANGDPWDFNIAGGYSNANVANYLPTYTGNISAGNVGVNGQINVSTLYAAGNVRTDSLLYANGTAWSFPTSYGNSNVEAYLPSYTGNLESLAGNVTTSANIQGDYLLGNIRSATGGYANANVEEYLPTYSGNLASLAGDVITTSNVGGLYFLGNGRYIQGITLDRISNGTSSVLVESNSNVNISVGNISNAGVFSADGLSLRGNINTSGVYLRNNNNITSGTKFNFDYTTGNLDLNSIGWIQSNALPLGVPINAVDGYFAAANALNSNLVLYSTADGVTWNVYSERSNISFGTIAGNVFAGSDGNLYSPTVDAATGNITALNVVYSNANAQFFRGSFFGDWGSGTLLNQYVFFGENGNVYASNSDFSYIVAYNIPNAAGRTLTCLASDYYFDTSANPVNFIMGLGEGNVCIWYDLSQSPFNVDWYGSNISNFGGATINDLAFGIINGQGTWVAVDELGRVFSSPGPIRDTAQSSQPFPWTLAASNVGNGALLCATFTGADSRAFGTVTVDGSGTIVSATVTAGGTGYTTPPVVYVIDPYNIGRDANITATVTNGVVTALNIVDGGIDYGIYGADARIVIQSPPTANTVLVVGSEDGNIYSTRDLVNYFATPVPNSGGVTSLYQNEDLNRLYGGTRNGFITYVIKSETIGRNTLNAGQARFFSNVSASFYSGNGRFLSGLYGNTDVDAYLSSNANIDIAARGNFYSSNISTGGSIIAVGNITAGNVVLTANIQGNVNGFSIGYRDIPQLTLSSNVTIPSNAGGQHYYANNAGNVTLTIPSSVSQSFAIGTSVLIVARNSNVLLSRSSGVTLYLAGNGINSDRTVTANGMGSLLKLDSDTWVVAGAGVV